MDREHRTAWILGGVLALGIGAAAAILGTREIRESRSDARIAESRALAATAIASADHAPDLALLLAVEAFELTHEGPAGDSYEARNALVTTLQRTLHLRAILRGHEGPVTTVAFSPLRTLVASGGEDGTVRLWDRRSRAEIKQLDGHKGRVASVAFSPDGTLLASAGRDAVIRLWDVDRGTLAGELRGHRGGVQQVTFSPDGRTLASRGDDRGGFSDRPDGTVRVWNVARRTQLGATIQTSASGMRFADGNRLTVVDAVGLITEHDAQRPRPYSEPSYDTGYTEYYRSEFTTSGTLLALSGEGGIEVWRVRGTMSRPVQILGRLPSQIVSAGRGRIGVGNSEGSLTYWGAWDYTPGVRTLEPGTSMSLANGGIEALTFEPNEVAVGGADGTVRLATLGDPWLRLLRYDSRWTRSGEPIRSPDGHWIARLGETGNEFRTPVTIRDAATREETGHRLETLSDAVAFHPDGRRVALVGRSGRLGFWDIERGAPVGEPLPSGFPPRGASNIALSPDGNVIAAWGIADAPDLYEAGFVLWDATRWAPIGEPVPVYNYSGAFDERLSFDNRQETFRYQNDEGGIAIDPLLVSSDLGQWRQRVCSLVARNLTEQEWRLYIPDRSYLETCPGLD